MDGHRPHHHRERDDYRYGGYVVKDGADDWEREPHHARPILVDEYYTVEPLAVAEKLLHH